MGLRSVMPSPKKRTSAGKKEQTFPYLLGEMEVTRANQAWCSDITYIPMHRGFMFLVAIMDWYSRYVLSWELSNSLETQFCLDALEVALQKATPQIFNSDKGGQYTSTLFIDRLLEEKIQVAAKLKGRNRQLRRDITDLRAIGEISRSISSTLLIEDILTGILKGIPAESMRE